MNTLTQIRLESEKGKEREGRELDGAFTIPHHAHHGGVQIRQHAQQELFAFLQG